MSDTIGRISVPALVDSGLTFPFTSDFGYGFSQERPVVVHQFGELDAKAEQRFAVGHRPAQVRLPPPAPQHARPRVARLVLGEPARCVEVVHLQRPERRPDHSRPRR